MSTLGWIAVPGGRIEAAEAGPAGTKAAVLRVLVVPRLDEQLADTAMADWPAALTAAVPVIEVHPPGAAPVTVANALRVRARSATWQGFFGHGISVTPWSPPPGYEPPTVTPTLTQLQAVTTTYTEVADRPQDTQVVHDQLTTWHDDTPPELPRSTTPQFAPVDFHRAVSLLREHPYVLRMLGLVLELEIASEALPHSTGTHEVRVSWPQCPITIESPWTAYEFDGERFLPASSGDIKSGLVDLSDRDKWAVVTVDVDSAVGKLRHAARTAVAGNDRDQPDLSAQLPTLKSAGLQVARAEREHQLAARAARGRIRSNASLTDAVLTADDLVLGYRFDVRPQNSNTWFSLHQRVATYRIEGELVGPDAEVHEEAHLKPHAAVRDEGGLRTDEIVARWSGWSLAAARPTFEGRASLDAANPAAESLIPYRFAMTFDVASESLPELHFGAAYQLRARVADIAGGGLQLNDPDASAHPTPTVPYTRYEPVPPPDLLVPDGLLVPDEHHPDKFVVDAAMLGPGGTLERLVVRSTPTSDGPDEFDGNPAYPANDSRTFVAPATTFQLAEQHGVLSTSDEASWRLAMRANPLHPSAPLPDPAALGAAATILAEPGGLHATVTDNRPWAGTWPDHEPKSIELVPATIGDEIALQWLGADTQDAQSPTVRVMLPPGQRAIVELSSMVLQEQLGNFAIKRLASSADADTAAITGRHPLLTPPRRLELVHAVRRPLKQPTGSIVTSRPAGVTYADLAPQDPILGIDTPSTGQLDIAAAWDEWTDAPQPATGSAPLPPTAVTRGAPVLPPLRQEFGDTKHRVVRYTVTAVSRYRDMFVATDADELFRNPSEPIVSSVPSSARPAPPVVVSTVPAFAWSDTVGGGLVRTRLGGRLRIELGRPWFVTGEGECLGVIVWPGGEDTVTDAVRPLVSWLNRDPIHPTSVPPALATEAMFAGAIDPIDVTLAETGDRARLLPYPVFFDDGRWYADVELPGAAAASYAPFAHLAVARFQRESLPGLDVSAVVRTDMVPVPPDRRLEVHQDATGVRVTLSGLSRQGARPNRVVALLERADATDSPVELTSLTASPGFPAWTRVAGATVAGTTNETLPLLAVPAEAGRLRVLVREIEDFGSAAPGVEVDTAHELTERTVYLDAVLLPLG